MYVFYIKDLAERVFQSNKKSRNEAKFNYYPSIVL